MIELRSLNLESAQRAVAAAIEAGQTKNRTIALVVVDKFGDLLACARTDGLAGRYVKAAHRKAYTAAVFERDTLGLMAWWKENEALGHQGPHDWNDPMLTTLPGGFVVVHGDQVVGGIGNSGGANGTPGLEDVDFAEIALAALGPGFRHRLDWS
jgi:glc operon protein GlcG